MLASVCSAEPLQCEPMCVSVCRGANKEPGSPVLAGDPRLIDELMQEMIGGAAWPAGQGARLSSAGFRSGIHLASANAEVWGSA